MTTFFPIWKCSPWVVDRERYDLECDVADRYNLEVPEKSHYHIHARLKDGREASLVDPGAHDNLTGDDWVKRVRRICAVYGLDVINKPLENELSVGGVGKGSQICKETADVPIALADGGAP